jgi:hypothetical protein
MRRLAFAALPLAVLALAGSATASAAPATAVRVTADRVTFAPALGETFSFSTPVVNAGDEPVSGLVAHLNILSYRAGVYVDPEDWSSERTQYLPPLAPGANATLRWRVKAVTAGSIGLSVTVVQAGAAGVEPAVGPAIRASVAGRKTFDTGGLLVLIVGVPGVLALTGLSVRGVRRRRT